MPDQYTEYQYDKDGNLIDPPTIARFEREMTEAAATGDDALIAVANEDYTDARKRVAETHNKAVQQRRDDDARLLAEDRDRNDRQAAQDARDRADQTERDRADELRRQRTEINAPGLGSTR